MRDVQGREGTCQCQGTDWSFSPSSFPDLNRLTRIPVIISTFQETLPFLSCETAASVLKSWEVFAPSLMCFPLQVLFMKVF